MSTLSDKNQMVAFNAKYASRGSRTARGQALEEQNTRAASPNIRENVGWKSQPVAVTRIWGATRLNSMSRARLITRVVRCMYIQDRNFVWSPAQWPPCRKNERARGWSRNEGTTHSGTREKKKNQPPRIHLSSTSWHDGGVSLATPPPGHWRLFLSLSFHSRNRRKPGDVNRGEHRSFANANDSRE